MTTLFRVTSLLLMLGPLSAEAASVTLGPRVDLTHAGKGHEVHVSAPALGLAPDGARLVTWAAEEGQVNNLYVARLGEPGARPVPDLRTWRDSARSHIMSKANLHCAMVRIA